MSRRPRKSRRGNFTRGRIWLVFIFILLRAADLFLYFSLRGMPKLQPDLGALITPTLWSLVLLTLIWRRQNWARYAMSILLLFSVGVLLIFEAELAEYFPANIMFIMVAYTAGQLIAALILIFSPSVQKLTSQAYV